MKCETVVYDCSRGITSCSFMLDEHSGRLSSLMLRMIDVHSAAI